MSETIENEEIKNLKREVAKLRLEGNLRKSLSNQLTIQKKIADEQSKQNKKVKLFIQVNIGNENQKSGVTKEELKDLYLYCKELDLNVIGLMCIPPANLNPEPYFENLAKLNESLNLPELSMGMSSDYNQALNNSSTFIRVGSSIFGDRN